MAWTTRDTFEWSLLISIVTYPVTVCLNWSLLSTSSCILFDKVADIATMDTNFGINARIILRHPYILRNWEPQCETTWALLMTTENSLLVKSEFWRTVSMKRVDKANSGEIKTIWYFPAMISCLQSYQFVMSFFGLTTYLHDLCSASSMIAVHSGSGKLVFILEGHNLNSLHHRSPILHVADTHLIFLECN